MRTYSQSTPPYDLTILTIFYFGVFASGASLFLPYVVVFGSYTVLGFDNHLASLIVIIGIVGGIISTYKYSQAHFLEDLQFVRKIGLMSFIAIIVAIVVYYLDYQNDVHRGYQSLTSSGPNLAIQPVNQGSQSLINLGIGFLVLIIGAGLMLLGSYLVGKQFNKLPSRNGMGQQPYFQQSQTTTQNGPNASDSSNLNAQRSNTTDRTNNTINAGQLSYCNNCGRKLIDDQNNYCGFCGYKIKNN